MCKESPRWSCRKEGQPCTITPNNPVLAANSAWQEHCTHSAAPARLLNTDLKVRWHQDIRLKASWHNEESQAQSKAGGSIPHWASQCRGWKDAELAGTEVEEQQKEVAEVQTQKHWEEKGCNMP